MDSAKGDVRIGEVVRGKVSATSKMGSVEVGLRQGSIAWLELDTQLGRLNNELDDADGPMPGDIVPGNPVPGEPGDQVEIRANTRLGNITIRRAPRWTRTSEL